MSAPNDQPERAGDSEPPSGEPLPHDWTPSSRRLTRTRVLSYRLAAPIALALLRLWWASCRMVKVIGDEHLERAIGQGPFIPVYWHDSQLFCVRYLLQQRHRGLKLGFLISPSVDGELPAMIASRAGFEVLRGSSSHSGAQTLRAYYQALRAGISTSINPDGPKGPRRVFKPGAVLLAQMLGRPLVPVATAARPAWRFRTWDRFLLPTPFSRVAIAVGPPQSVPKSLDAEALERWQHEMGQRLESLEAEAEAALR